MHRAQIVLEEWQYQRLKSQAQRTGESMSHIVRALLNQHLAPKTKQRALAGVAGIGASSSAHGRDHDQNLYGKRSR